MRAAIGLRATGGSRCNVPGVDDERWLDRVSGSRNELDRVLPSDPNTVPILAEQLEPDRRR
jgi:hypothetical protein